jgi:hypothetical protein
VLLVGFLLLAGSGTRHSALIEKREQENLQLVPPEDTTPLVALTTVAFGGFRGLVADALWVRANKMQENGQFFEMVQLAQWITQLEPRVPEVWAFQAWNLAYNISVLFPDFEDRWRWVSHGVDLLKEEGLTHNPTSASLHWDIGWMYQHKIGMQFDLAHRLYKQRLAEQMETALPDGRLPEGGLRPEALQVLENEFFMEPDRMRALDEEFGPLDWRLPETHSLYWSTRGLEYRASEFRIRSLRRMQMQSISVLMRGGIYLNDPETGHTVVLPRLDLIPVVVAMYEEMLEGHPNNQYLRLGFKNFLRDASVLYGEYGRMTESLEMYEKLAQRDREIPSGRENFQRFVQSFLVQDPTTLDRRQAMSKVVALLQNAKNPDISEVRSRGFTQMARQVHRLYQESRVNDEHLERTGLPPFEVMQRMLN